MLEIKDQDALKLPRKSLKGSPEGISPLAGGPGDVPPEFKPLRAGGLPDASGSRYSYREAKVTLLFKVASIRPKDGGRQKTIQPIT